MEYVVIESGGKQYRVKAGDIIDVDRIESSNGSTSFEKILLHVNDVDVKIGNPYVAGAIVEGKILEQIRGKKIRVARFTAKSRHRRVIGFRPSLTRVQIEKISPLSLSKVKSKVAKKVMRT